MIFNRKDREEEQRTQREQRTKESKGFPSKETANLRLKEQRFGIKLYKV